MSRRGWSLFVALGLIWGIPYLFIRIAVTELDPVVLACCRTGLAALLLVVPAIRSGAFRGLRRRWKAVLLFALVEVVGPWVLLGHVETRLPSSTTGLLIATVPIATALLVIAFGQDRLGPRRAVGLLVGFCGVALLVGFDLRGGDWIALLQAAGVVVGYAVGPVIITQRLAHLNPLGVITASLAASAVLTAPFALSRLPSRVSLGVVGSVAVLGIVCTAAAFLTMFALIAEAGPARMTLITYINPVVAVALGAAVLHEPLTTGLLIGFPLIVLGSVLGTWRERRRDDSLPAERLGAPSEAR